MALRWLSVLLLALLLTPISARGAIVAHQHGSLAFGQVIGSTPFGALSGPIYSVYDNFDGYVIPSGGSLGGANRGLSFAAPGSLAPSTAPLQLFEHAATVTLSTNGLGPQPSPSVGPWVIDNYTGSGGADKSYGRGKDYNASNPNPTVSKIDSVDETGAANGTLGMSGKTLFAGGPVATGGTRTISFSFAALVDGVLTYELPTYFGILYTDGFGVIDVKAYRGATLLGSLTYTPPFDTLISGQTGEDTWIGVSGLGEITRVDVSLINIPSRIGNTLGGGIELDHLYYAGSVTTFSPASATTPEPSSLAIWALGFVATLRRPRRLAGR